MSVRSRHRRRLPCAHPAVALAMVLAGTAAAQPGEGPLDEGDETAEGSASQPESLDDTSGKRLEGAQDEEAGARGAPDDESSAGGDREPVRGSEPSGQAPAPDSDDPSEAPPPGEVKGADAEAAKRGEQGSAKTPPEGLQEPIGSDEKRPLPDYDGRGDAPITAGDVLIWIPRGIFHPVYLVAEYGLRWPLGRLTTAIDEADVPDLVRDFFTFGPRDNYGIVPSFLIDFGLRPSIGLYFFGDDVGDVDGLGLRSHLAFGGADWYRATGLIQYELEEEDVDSHQKLLRLKGIFSHRPDRLFWGFGPRSLDDHEASFVGRYAEGVMGFRGGFWRSSWLRVEAGVRDAAFRPDGCCAIWDLDVAVDRGLFEKPPVFDDGYLIGRASVNGALDTRPRRFAYEGEASDHVAPPGSGVKLGVRSELGGGLRETSLPAGASARPLYVRYGGTLGGYVDLYRQRVLGLQAIVDFVDPIGDGIIPFTELVSLGGNRPMRGFLRRRMVDRSSAVALLDYRWPIWVWLDGTIHYAVGNVFGPHLEGFDPDLLRQSFGMGFRATGARDHTFELLLAGGTEPFIDGSTPDSFRFVFGATSGF